MKKIFLHLSLLIICSQTVFAQYSTSWIRTLDGPLNSWDEASAITVDDSGNVFITGNSITGVGYISDFMTAKYNNLGELQWVKTLNLFAYDGAQNMLLDKERNLILSGTNEAGYIILKYSYTGDLIWTANHDYGYLKNSIALDDSGNIYLCGMQDYKSVLVKFNSEGIEQWYKLYSGPANNVTRTFAISLDNAGYIYVAGSTDALTGNSILLMKYSSNGDTIWTKFYGDSLYTNEVNAITTDEFCNIYLTGYSGKEYEPINPITLKYDSSGTLMWARYNKPAGATFGQGIALSLDKENNLFVAGYAIIPGKYSDFVISKQNSNGDSIWTSIYNGTANNNDYLYDMVMDSSANVYVTGGTSDLNGGWNCVTIMYDSNGQQKAIQKFNGNGNGEDEGFSIALDRWHNVFVGGRATDSVYSYDFLLIKYGENLTDVKEPQNTQPSDFLLYQNYPNPFNPSTKIRYSVPQISQVQVKVFDILGDEIEVLVKEEKSAGTYELTWNGENLPSGVYFYQMKAGSFVQTRKMILMK